MTDPGHATAQGQPITDHTNAANAVAYSPDGRTLTSASSDKTLWMSTGSAATPAGAIDDICRTVGRDLTESERHAYLGEIDAGTPTCPHPTA